MMRNILFMIIVTIGWIVHASGGGEIFYQQIDLSRIGSGITQELYGRISIDTGVIKSEVFSDSLAAMRIMEVYADGKEVQLSKDIADIIYELPYSTQENQQGKQLTYRFSILPLRYGHIEEWFFPVLGSSDTSFIDGYIFDEKVNNVKITFYIKFPDGSEVGPFGMEFSMNRAREILK